MYFKLKLLNTCNNLSDNRLVTKRIFSLLYSVAKTFSDISDERRVGVTRAFFGHWNWIACQSLDGLLAQ